MGNDTFFVALSATSGAALGTPSSVVVTTTDNDSTSSGGAGVPAAVGGVSTGGGGALDLAFLLAGLAAWTARGLETRRRRGPR